MLDWVRRLASATLATALLLTATSVQGAGSLNIYTSRHYQADEALYDAFTEATGITVNRIEGKGDALIERLKAEGVNSPADVFITADAGRLWRADQAELFQPVASKTLAQRVPENLRHPDGHWFGFSTRARLIFYDKSVLDGSEIATYEALADPRLKGMICIRSSSNVYNQSLLGSIIAAHGEEAAETWAKGVVANMARDPAGGDTDQIRSVAAGECAVAVANSYYFIRLLKSDKEKDRAVAEAVGWVFPNQDGRGSHVNISGAGVLKHAPNKAAAVKFLEFLASDQAQAFFADASNEYPVVAEVDENQALAGLGNFKTDPVNVALYGENQPTAQKIFDRVGWK